MSNLQSSACWKDPEEVIWSTIHSTSVSPFKMKDANDLVEKYIELAENKSSVFILDLRKLEHSIDHGVIFYFATHTKMSSLINYQIFLTNSLPGWFFASHFTNYIDKEFPCRVFSEEKDALEWLHSIL